MKFDESDKVLLGSINATEATAYISFLYVERARHTIDVEEARKIQSYWISSNSYSVGWGEFWESAQRRHLKDIKEIDLKLKEVRERFNLK